MPAQRNQILRLMQKQRVHDDCMNLRVQYVSKNLESKTKVETIQHRHKKIRCNIG